MRYKEQDLLKVNRCQKGTKIIHKFTFFQIRQFNIFLSATNDTKR
jgi:hypothetical protein